jgi:hypothetical protein
VLAKTMNCPSRELISPLDLSLTTYTRSLETVTAMARPVIRVSVQLLIRSPWLVRW